MSIEKMASLIGVAVVCVLLGIVIFSREDREETPARRETGSSEAEKTDEATRPVRSGRGRKGEGPSRHEPARDRGRPLGERGGAKETAPPAVPAVDPSAGEAPPRRVVTIRPGDTFASIAKREYGRERRYLDILAANPGVDPRRLRPGTEIVLPALASADTNAGSETPVSTGPGRRHRVRKTETLSGIARRYYAAPADWPRILEANRERLTRPRDLRPGMVLVIP